MVTFTTVGPRSTPITTDLSHIDDVIAEVRKGHGNDIKIHAEEFLKNHAGYQRELKDLKHVDLAERTLTGTEATEFKELGKELKKAKESLRKAEGKSDSIGVQDAKAEMEAITDRIKDRISDHGYDFHEQVQANKTAMEALRSDHREALEKLGETVRDDITQLRDKITTAKEAKTPGKVNWQGAEMEVAQAEKHLAGMKDSYKSAKAEITKEFETAMKNHTKVEGKFGELARKVEDATGHDLMAGMRSETSAASSVAHTTGTVEKAAMGGGTKFMLGAAGVGLGVDGARRVFNPDESTGLGFVELAGAAAAGYKLLARNAKTISHAMGA